jgi:pyruvate dehydrogenase E2 component (dihydrolipoamide acetyltransferase)
MGLMTVIHQCPSREDGRARLAVSLDPTWFRLDLAFAHILFWHPLTLLTQRRCSLILPWCWLQELEKKLSEEKKRAQKLSVAMKKMVAHAHGLETENASLLARLAAFEAQLAVGGEIRAPEPSAAAPQVAEEAAAATPAALPQPEVQKEGQVPPGKPATAAAPPAEEAGPAPVPASAPAKPGEEQPSAEPHAEPPAQLPAAAKEAAGPAQPAPPLGQATLKSASIDKQNAAAADQFLAAMDMAALAQIEASIGQGVAAKQEKLPRVADNKEEKAAAEAIPSETPAQTGAPTEVALGKQGKRTGRAWGTR